MTVFAIVYVLAGALLLAVELKAVRNDDPGDTITEYTRSMPITMALMGSLLVWAVYHFIVGEFIGYTSVGNIVALALGAVGGLASYVWRRQKTSV